MNTDILNDRKIGLLAIIGPAYALISIAISIMLSPWFSWHNNAISDLGVNPVAPTFNISLIIAGFLVMIFAVSMFIQLNQWLGKVGMLLMLFAAIALVGIGAFTENSPPWHFYFSVSFFVLLLFTSIALGILFLRNLSTRYLGIAAFAVAIIGIIGWATYEGPGVAIPEALTFVPGAIWFGMLGEWYYKRK